MQNLHPRVHPLDTLRSIELPKTGKESSSSFFSAFAIIGLVTW
ncbi:LPXTG cell wall anchor domain-containing protein [Methanobrevibacter arboriphilus]